MRDTLLGREPKDYDIATDATPEEVLRIFPMGNTIGAHFGVVLVKQGEFSFEIATFRAEGEYRDGRRPESVTFTTPEEDAKRRDFTINGMLYDPVDDRGIDYVGGQADLEAGVIRAIGDPVERFREDYLRMLRAVRFATVLDFDIEQHTWAALQVRAPHVIEISPERIREELDKIWRSPRRVKGFDLLVDSHLMQAVLPEIMNLQGCEQPPQFHPRRTSRDRDPALRTVFADAGDGTGQAGGSRRIRRGHEGGAHQRRPGDDLHRLTGEGIKERGGPKSASLVGFGVKKIKRAAVSPASQGGSRRDECEL